MRPAQTRSPKLLWAAAAVTALVLASCGDDSDETVSLTSQPDATTTTTAPDEPRRLTFGDTLEPGVVYDYPMDLHCGLDVLGEFNGTAWVLTEAPVGNPEQGAGQAPPEHWPLGPEGLEGQVRLVEEARIEYALPEGELIAVYEPSPDPFVACD